MKILKKISVFLALFIGIMSVMAGSRVLLGIDVKDYNVLPLLVVYNVILGIVSIFVAFLIFKEKPIAKKFSILILLFHFIVFIIVFFIVKEAAFQSKMAMLFRTFVWGLIVLSSKFKVQS